MGFVNSLTGKSYDAAFYSVTQTRSQGYLGPKAETLLGTATCKFWVGSAADSVTQNKYGVDLAGVVIIDPDDLTFTIPDGAKVMVNGVAYQVIQADDVALQEMVIQIPVSRYSDE